MARTRLDPYLKDEVVRLRNPLRPQELRLGVMSPDGKIVLHPPTAGVVRVVLDQVGTWKYRWGKGEQLELEVVARPVSNATTKLADVPDRLPMTVTRRPRY